MHVPLARVALDVGFMVTPVSRVAMVSRVTLVSRVTSVFRVTHVSRVALVSRLTPVYMGILGSFICGLGSPRDVTWPQHGYYNPGTSKHTNQVRIYRASNKNLVYLIKLAEARGEGREGR